MTLKQVRIKAGIQAQQLATHAKVSRTILYNAENNKPIGILSANKIVNALNELTHNDHSIASLGIAVRT